MHHDISVCIISHISSFFGYQSFSSTVTSQNQYDFDIIVFPQTTACLWWNPVCVSYLTKTIISELWYDFVNLSVLLFHQVIHLRSQSSTWKAQISTQTTLDSSSLWLKIWVWAHCSFTKAETKSRSLPKDWSRASPRTTSTKVSPFSSSRIWVITTGTCRKCSIRPLLMKIFHLNWYSLNHL